MADDKQGQAADGAPSEEPGPGGEPRPEPKSAEGAEKGSKGEPGDSADPGGKKDGGAGKHGDQRERMSEGVYQGFYGNVYAPYATFGTSGGTAGDDEERSRGRDEGPVEDTDIARI